MNKIEKLEQQIFSAENMQVLETFCQNTKAIHQILKLNKKAKKIDKTLTKHEMAKLLNVDKLKDLEIVNIHEFNTDIERDCLTSNLINNKLATPITGINTDSHYFNGTSIVSNWKSSNDTFIKCDNEHIKIKGRNLIRTMDNNIKYLIFKGETNGVPPFGQTWMCCSKNNTLKAVQDFEALVSKYQIYKNKFITIHDGMTLSSTIDCKLNLNDIGMSANIKDEVNKIIQMFKFSKTLKDNNLVFKRNILFHGAPGYGKTTIINAIIKEVLNFGGTVFSFSLKEEQRSVDELMNTITIINNTYPAMLVLEDVDLIAKSRNEYSNLSNTILKLVEDNKKFIILASTNNVKLLDGAFVRHGRMEKVFHINLTIKDKYKIFEKHLIYYNLIFNNWKDNQKIIKFLNNSNTSGAVINSVLMCSKQDTIMINTINHETAILNSIKNLTWQNGNDDQESNYIL